MHDRRLSAILVSVCLVTSVLSAGESIDPLDGLEYRPIGPAAGGRVSRVTGIPGDPTTFWAATAAGGVWKSVNGGTTWESMFDDQPVSSIGSIAVAPSDPNVVYVGSGEANIRGNVAEGNGIYRTADAGETWAHVWTAEGQIGTVIVHPTDPDVAYAAVLGSPFGPGEDRGVYRTTDGGASWDRVLHVDENTGASDVCFDPTNPRILFAGTWPTRRSPWHLASGGEGGGVWTSRDGGDTWTRLGTEHGLPGGIVGRVGVQVAPSNAKRVYALVEADEGGLFRSDDGGESWERISASRGVRQRAWYYSTLTVDPRDADTVWFPQVSMLKTIDGGKKISPVKGGGWDYHDVWIDPVDPRRLVVGSDAGVSLSRDGGATWERPPIPISQFYHVSVDTRTPYRVLGSVQDLGTVSGPSRSLHGGGILLSDWHPVGGGEAGYVVADPSNPDVVWAGEYLGFLSRWDGRTGRAPHIGAYPENGSGRGSGDLAYRFQWTSPIEVSPHDPNVVYHGANVLFRTDDGGQTWTAISPDLTRDDAQKQQWSGGPITGDNTGVEYYGTIFAVAESPVTPGVIWAGTDDGRVHLTRDAGKTWTDVTPNGMPEWATVGGIEASRFDDGVAYVVADRHRLDDESPYLWKTAGFGKSWTRLGKDLDPEVYLKVVREDPVVRGLLYLGTERGVLFSRDDGARFESLRLDMPTVAVVDLAVTDDDLVVGTLGRSAFILDDLTAVRETTPAVVKADAHLYPPPAAIEWYLPGQWSGPLGSKAGAGKNPGKGASITYRLGTDVEGEIAMEIVDADGAVLRRLSSEPRPRFVPEGHPNDDPDDEREPELSKNVGINRASWDFELDGSRWIEGAISEYSRVPGPTALPGTYTVRLTVGDRVLEQPLRVEPDPRAPFDADAARAQFAFLRGLRDDVNRIVDLVDAIRGVRGQLADRAARLGETPAASGLIEVGASLDARLDAIERGLHSRDAEVSYDVLAGRDGGAKLFSRYGWLAGGAHAHPGPPTQGQREVAETLRADLEARQAELDDVMTDVEALNAEAATAGFGYVVVP